MKKRVWVKGCSVLRAHKTWFRSLLFKKVFENEENDLSQRLLLRTVTKDREKNYPIADQYVPSNDPRDNCETNVDSSPLLVSKVANEATQVKDILVAFVTHPEKSTACTP